MTPAQTALTERIRGLVSHEPTVRELSMFGVRSFLVNEKMSVSALKNGGLLVRVASDQHEELLGRPGAAQAEMGTGRDMGPGWIEVAAESLRDEENFSYWVGVALEYNRVVTVDSP